MKQAKRILVIDDDPFVLDLLRRILEGDGYEVVVAANGQDGMEIFRQQPFDLLITDMVMPMKDGLQTILELRDIDPDLPVIATSGGGTISKERYLTVAGYLDNVVTIPKPFTIEEIISAAARLLHGPEAAPEA